MRKGGGKPGGYDAVDNGEKAQVGVSGSNVV